MVESKSAGDVRPGDNIQHMHTVTKVSFDSSTAVLEFGDGCAPCTFDLSAQIVVETPDESVTAEG